MQLVQMPEQMFTEIVKDGYTNMLQVKVFFRKWLINFPMTCFSKLKKEEAIIVLPPSQFLCVGLKWHNY